jgi:hypothetical protein
MSPRGTPPAYSPTRADDGRAASADRVEQLATFLATSRTYWQRAGNVSGCPSANHRADARHKKSPALAGLFMKRATRLELATFGLGSRTCRVFA